MENKQTQLFLRVKNFKCFEDITIEFKPLMLLFGTNGSGKSTLHEAIRFFFYNFFDLYMECNAGFSKDLKLNINFGNIDIEFSEELFFSKDKKRIISFEFLIKDLRVEYYELITFLLTKYQNMFLDWLDLLKERDYKSFLITIDIGYDNDRLIRNLSFYEANFIEQEKAIKNLNFLDNLLHRDLTKAVIFDDQDNALWASGQYFYRTRIFFFDFWIEKIMDKQSTNLDLNDIEKIKDRYAKYVVLFNYIYSFNRENFIVHVPEIREKPKKFFVLEGDKFVLGQYYNIPFVFEYYYPISIVIDDLRDFLYDKTFFSEYEFEPEEGVEYLDRILNRLLYELGICFRIDVEKNLDLGVGFIKFKTSKNSEWLNLIEASSGLLNAIPIISSLIFPMYYYGEYETEIEKSILIVEQPELHLHPKIQSKFVDVFHRILQLYNYECNLIIETHSEHILRKIQLLIAQDFNNENGEQLVDKIQVYYLERNNEKNISELKRIEIDQNGFIKTPFPEGFFDEASELSLALLEAQLKRKN